MKQSNVSNIWNNLFLFSIASSIAVIYRNETGDLPYLIMLLGATLSLLLFYILKKNPKLILFLKKSSGDIRKNSYALKYLNVCWVFIVISWLYGVMVGLVNANASENIFRNFFGLNLYLLLPLLFTLKPSKRDLFFAFAVGCAIQCAIAFYELIQVGIAFTIVASISEARFFYSVGLISAFPFYAYYLSQFLFASNSMPFGIRKRGGLFSIFIAIVLSFFIIVPPASKGFILAWIIVSSYILIIYVFGLLKRGVITLKALCINLFISVSCILLFYYFGDVLLHSFSNEEISNATRAEQYHHIINDISFIGNGLGALLSSGYVRDEAGYGMELTYLNLLHKLGFFSIFIFLSYFCTYYAAFKIYIMRDRVFESFFAFGGMSYCIIGSANPLLLSPAAVTLHCVIIYLILDELPNDA